MHAKAVFYNKVAGHFRPRRGRDAGYPTPPAPLPACGFSPPGSSGRRAAALPWLGGCSAPQGGWRVDSGPACPAHGACAGLRPTVTPCPTWTALPPSEDDAGIRLPRHPPRPCVWRATLPWHQACRGSPTFAPRLALPARPCGPRQTLPPRPLARPLSGLPVRDNRRRLPDGLDAAVPDCRGCGPPAGLQSARWTLPMLRAV